MGSGSSSGVDAETWKHWRPRARFAHTGVERGGHMRPGVTPVYARLAGAHADPRLPGHDARGRHLDDVHLQPVVERLMHELNGRVIAVILAGSGEPLHCFVELGDADQFAARRCACRGPGR